MKPEHQFASYSSVVSELTTLVIGISEDIEDISKEIDHVLLEELVGDFRRCASEVVDQVECDCSSAIVLHVSTTERDILLRPRSAISRIVCLTAHRMESLTSLNCGGGSSSRANSQLVSCTREQMQAYQGNRYH